MKQHMAFSFIGMAARDQARDEIDDFRDMLGHFRGNIGRRAANRCHILGIGSGKAGGDRVNRGALRGGACVDLVINIGDVARIADAGKTPPQQAHQHIKHHRRARIAEMRVIIDCRPADIDRHMIGIGRSEGLARAAQGVVKYEVAHLLRSDL